MWQYIWDKSSHVSIHPFSAAYLGHGGSSLSRRAKTSLTPSSSSSGKTGGITEPKKNLCYLVEWLRAVLFRYTLEAQMF